MGLQIYHLGSNRVPDDCCGDLQQQDSFSWNSVTHLCVFKCQRWSMTQRRLWLHKQDKLVRSLHCFLVVSYNLLTTDLRMSEVLFFKVCFKVVWNKGRKFTWMKDKYRSVQTLYFRCQKNKNMNLIISVIWIREFLCWFSGIRLLQWGWSYIPYSVAALSRQIRLWCDSPEQDLNQ